MINIYLPKKLSAVLATGSFFGVVILMMSSNPLSSPSVIAIFFILLLLFLISLTKVLISANIIRADSGKKAVSLAVGLVAILMLMSAQSLGVIDVIILLLFIGGLFFYLSQRT